MSRSGSRESIRVLLVDDHPIVVDGLSAVFTRERDLEVIGSAADGAQALEQAATTRPDVVLLDLAIPPPSGAELIRRLRDVAPEARVLILTTYDDDEHLFEAVSAGASGYVVKGSPVAEVVESVRAIHRGQSRLTPELTARLMARVSSQPIGASPSSAGSQLTAREQEVLQLLVTGATNHEIADAIFVSPRTVKAHVASIFQKLDVHDRTAAAMEAVRRRLVELPDGEA